MTNNYTPSANDVEFAYMDSTERILGTLPFAASAEFDRFIAKVKADAWDEGARALAGVLDLSPGGTITYVAPDNPYRQEGER